MIVVVGGEVICRPAYLDTPDHPVMIRYYRYYGSLSGWVVVEPKGRSGVENSHGVHREGVEFEGNGGGNYDQTVVPYCTEYDFMEPEDMPEWAAMLWVKFQEMRIKEGKVPLKESIPLMRRITRLRERMGDEKRVLRVVDSRYEGKAGRTEEGEDDYDY
jgi:hypothetical protein